MSFLISIILFIGRPMLHKLLLQNIQLRDLSALLRIYDTEFFIAFLMALARNCLIRFGLVSFTPYTVTYQKSSLEL